MRIHATQLKKPKSLQATAIYIQDLSRVNTGQEGQKKIEIEMEAQFQTMP